MTSTREQIEAARDDLELVLDSKVVLAHLSPGETASLRLLLAATAQPTDEELNAECITWLKRKRAEESTDVRSISRTEAYIAGARREKRKTEPCGETFEGRHMRDWYTYTCDRPKEHEGGHTSG